MFIDRRKTSHRVRTKTGGILVATPNGNNNVNACIVKIGRRSCDRSTCGIVDGTDYAAGYLTPIIGILRRGFNVVGNAVAAARDCAKSRHLLSTDRHSLHHTQTTTLGVMPAAAKTTGTITLIVPRVTNGLGKVTLQMPAPGMSIISLMIRIRGPTVTSRIGRILGRTTRNTVGNVLTCDSLPLISVSCHGASRSSVMSSDLAVIVKNSVIGIIT